MRIRSFRALTKSTPLLGGPSNQIIGIVERQKGVLRAKVMRIRSFRALTKSTPLLGGPSNL
jgi:hypothetical protein